jgi:hypothetical protein
MGAENPKTPDAAAAAVAHRQYGNITTHQLRAAGLNDVAILHRVRRGRLFLIHHGVYAVGRLRPAPASTPRTT